MDINDWWFNIGILAAAVLTIIAGIKLGLLAFAICAALTALYIANGVRERTPPTPVDLEGSNGYE